MEYDAKDDKLPHTLDMIRYFVCESRNPSSSQVIGRSSDAIS
ncbi:MAG: hypothetical protein WBD91_01130 [Acidobacteriaceae bacterium]